MGNKCKSLTNDESLLQLEEFLQFDFSKVVKEMAEQKGSDDGFLFVDHHTKTGNFLKSEDGWTPAIEEALKLKGYITRVETRGFDTKKRKR